MLTSIAVHAADQLLALFGEFDAVDEADDVVTAAIASDGGDGFDDVYVVQVVIQVDLDLGAIIRTRASLVTDELHDVAADLLPIGAERLAVVEYNLLQVAAASASKRSLRGS